STNPNKTKTEKRNVGPTYKLAHDWPNQNKVTTHRYVLHQTRRQRHVYPEPPPSSPPETSSPDQTQSS
ncbi:unnamed protein product, partial [Brassica rapa subsp. narinosa]